MLQMYYSIHKNQFNDIYFIIFLVFITYIYNLHLNILIQYYFPLMYINYYRILFCLFYIKNFITSPVLNNPYATLLFSPDNKFQNSE